MAEELERVAEELERVAEWCSTVIAFLYLHRPHAQGLGSWILQLELVNGGMGKHGLDMVGHIPMVSGACSSSWPSDVLFR